MGDVKKKSSKKSIKGKSKKTSGKSKNYILENVKKLRQLQNERPKPKDEGREFCDHPISYAERLKAVTSPHIRMIQKLSLVKEKSQQNVIEKKKSNVVPNMMKAKISQINEINLRSQPLDEIKMRKSPRQAIKLTERTQKEEKKFSSVIQVKTPQKSSQESAIKKFETNFDTISNNMINRVLKESDKRSECAKKDMYDITQKKNNFNQRTPKKLKGNSKSESEIGYSESQVLNPPKGFKNEGCQAKPNNSFESINSTTVVRFPRMSNRMSRQLNKNVCEKSLQTEVSNSKQSPPAPKIRNRSPKKSPTLNNVVTTPSEGKNPEIKKSNPTNSQLNKMVTNSIKSLLNTKTAPASELFSNKNKSKLNSNKNKLNPADEKANMILNDIISASNVDIKKLYSEITRVQKTSPFARHHTIFEKRSPEEIKKEHELYMKNDVNRSPGTIVLPDHKRKEYLAQIKKRHSDLLKQLNSMPVNAKSLEARQQKLQLGKALDSMDSAIKLFSKNNLLVDLNPLSST